MWDALVSIFWAGCALYALGQLRRIGNELECIGGQLERLADEIVAMDRGSAKTRSFAKMAAVRAMMWRRKGAKGSFCAAASSWTDNPFFPKILNTTRLDDLAKPR